MIRILLSTLLLAAPLAWAGLDGAPSQLRAAAAETTRATTAAGASYTRVQRTLPTRVVVDEYFDGTGRVFALAWSGPFKPDLKELLGPHFENFRERGAARRGGNRSQLAVDTGDAVVVSEGHMGAFHGRAWLPARLPAGFDTLEMK